MRPVPLLACLTWALAGLPALAQVDSFFAPPESRGRLTLRLHPMENVGAGSPRLVTFGVPFTRGSIGASGLATLRVLKGNVELPAFVEQLTPWRHATNPAVEFLCLIGVQRARPLLAVNEKGKERLYEYRVWNKPLACLLLPAAIAGVLPGAGQRLRFANPSRAKDYRAFMPSVFL